MDLKTLSAVFRKLGATDPEASAVSQLKEGIPQLARFVFLRQAWRAIVCEDDSRTRQGEKCGRDLTAARQGEVCGQLCLADQLPFSYTLRMAPSPVPVTRDPEVLSGTACFAGTRVPVSALMDYLRGGERVDDFLDDFPTVSRDQVNAVLKLATEAASQHAHSA